MNVSEAEDRADTFVRHDHPERTVDLGEVRMNYAVAGDPDSPALLLIPGQSESWWGYEPALERLAEHFRTFAVDLRGQGRSTWTPGRYTLDNFGNDLVRFIDLVIGRPALVAGHSSGGVLAAWLSAYARPGQIRGAVYEDPPLFSSETEPACGPSIRQGMGPVFAAWHKWLGDQWSIGDWHGLRRALSDELPPVLLEGLPGMRPNESGSESVAGPPQNLREYDPEWARAFVSGNVTAGCDQATMLSRVRAPVLLTHHFRRIDPDTGHLLGAVADVQAQRARQLIEAAGQPVSYRSLPEMPHSMHATDPEFYARTVTEWAKSLA
ncbi:Pimeloyl-ACP methyl ester carboxylesterase [Actinopolyspora lacussalsi subsp. righensis]|uniref:Pimeloyl-ACP methyl ester carboxylesterase n=1 Tax=Actinopolyspora righensis TaxID=995060 RepID=A0A1I6YZ72_9ACTN|nr:alpha/beta hydrolase [Actinopolyspora righensis]SFT55734.1 Pimeloyl-ACP methyl ester carboxylesterase [Actinopolyspora righensis]